MLIIDKDLWKVIKHSTEKWTRNTAMSDSTLVTRVKLLVGDKGQLTAEERLRNATDIGKGQEKKRDYLVSLSKFIDILRKDEMDFVAANDRGIPMPMLAKPRVIAGVGDEHDRLDYSEFIEVKQCAELKATPNSGGTCFADIEIEILFDLFIVNRQM
jgi:hypothetical protein